MSFVECIPLLQKPFSQSKEPDVQLYLTLPGNRAILRIARSHASKKDKHSLTMGPVAYDTALMM